MNSGEYRQKPLDGFETIEAIRAYMVSSEADDSIESNSSYTLTPNNFLNAIERVDFVNFRESMYNGQVYFNSRTTGGAEEIAIHLTLDTNISHLKQASTLAHEMMHVDRGQPDFGYNPVVDRYGTLSLKELKEHYPEAFQEFMEYMEISSRIKDEEERIVSEATDRFYESHPSLAKLALCHLWDRFEKST